MFEPWYSPYPQERLPLQSIIRWLRPMEMPDKASIKIIVSKANSGDRPQCCDCHHCSSNKCQDTWWFYGDQNTLSPNYNAGRQQTIIIRDKSLKVLEMKNRQISYRTLGQSPCSSKISVKLTQSSSSSMNRFTHINRSQYSCFKPSKR